MNGNLTLSVEIDKLLAYEFADPHTIHSKLKRFITTGSAKLVHVVGRFFRAITEAGVWSLHVG